MVAVVVVVVVVVIRQIGVGSVPAVKAIIQQSNRTCT
jgi:hypothetical protein